MTQQNWLKTEKWQNLILIQSANLGLNRKKPVFSRSLANLVSTDHEIFRWIDPHNSTWVNLEILYVKFHSFSIPYMDPHTEYLENLGTIQISTDFHDL